MTKRLTDEQKSINRKTREWKRDPYTCFPYIVPGPGQVVIQGISDGKYTEELLDIPEDGSTVKSTALFSDYGIFVGSSLNPGTYLLHAKE